MEQTSIHQQVFPSPIEPDSVKKEASYGLRVARAAYRNFDPNNFYIQNRNAAFIQNRQFSKGIQPAEPYYDLMNIDGKNAFVNLDFSPTPIAAGFRRVVVGGYMNQEEVVVARAMNKAVIDKRNQKYLEAKFRMENPDFVNGLKEMGVEMFDQDEYTPNTPQELDLWKDMMPREREELLMELAIQHCFVDNDIEAMKEQCLRNLWDVNLAATYIYTEPSGMIRIKLLRPEDCVYGPSDKNDFSDIQYAGHFIKMKVSDARIMFKGQIDEKDLYKLARTYSSVYSNGSELTEWNNSWYTSFSRPYDDYIVQVMHVWYKVVGNITYVEGTDSRNRKVFDVQEIKGPITSKTKKAGSKEKETSYEGYWFVGSDIICDWGESKNMIRYNTALDKVICPYTIYMPENDGSMDTPSMTSSIKESIRMMDLCNLKIQQLISKIAPDGWDVDIANLMDVDLGTGQGTLSPLELIQIKRETGDGFWNSRNPDGSYKSGSPYSQQALQIGGSLNNLIQVYNLQLEKIRNFLKVNEARDGASVNPRLGVGIYNAQAQASNNATYHIYLGWVKMFEAMAKKVGQRIWDCLLYGKDNEGYKGILGEQNVEFIREAKAITANNYDIQIQATMSQEERQYLEANITAALTEKSIDLADAVAIREIKNNKLAYRYLVVAQERKIKRAEQTAAKQSEYNAQVQMQSNAQAQQLKIALEQMKQEAETFRKTLDIMSKSDVEFQKFLQSTQLESMKVGFEIPDYLQIEIIDELEKRNEQEEMQEQMALEQQQQEAQGQEMEQEVEGEEEEEMGQEQADMEVGSPNTMM